jgi:hypothetical protein
MFLMFQQLHPVSSLPSMQNINETWSVIKQNFSQETFFSPANEKSNIMNSNLIYSTFRLNIHKMFRVIL